MSLLIDTNVYTAWKRGNEGVMAIVRDAREILVSTVVAGELLFGFRHGARTERNTAEFDRFLESPYVTCVPVTMVTADRFGRIAAQLRSAGRPIPTNDIWLAAHAMETGAELVSFDRHFDSVSGLVWRHLE